MRGFPQLGRSAAGSTTLAAAFLAIASSASVDAKADTNDVVMAEALFRDGRDLLAEGDSERACPKLAESFRLDPASGSLLALAICHEREGKLASAWAEYVDVASRSRKEGRDDRAKAAHAKAVDLESKLSSLTIVLAQGASLKGVEVRRNGVVIPAAWLGTAVPVDGGPVTIEAIAPHQRPWHASVSIAATGDRRTVTIPAFGTDDENASGRGACAVSTTESVGDGSSVLPPPEAETDGEPPISHAKGSTALKSPQAPPAATHGGSSAWRTVGYVTGAVGILGLGVGGLFGILALNKNSDSKSECLNGGDFCTAGGRQDRSDAVTFGNVSTTSFATGAVLAVAGTAMILWGGSTEARPAPGAFSLRAVPAAGPSGVGGVLLGSF